MAGKPVEVLVVGAEGVGKTCATLWFVHNYHVHDDTPQLDFDTFECTVGDVAVALVDGPEVLLAETDAVWPMLYYEAHARRAAGILALFDLTRPQTLADARTIVERTQRIRDRDDLAPLPVALVGTHTDEPNARAAAAALGASYAEACPRSGDNIHPAFTDAITAFLDVLPALNDNDPGSPSPRARRRHRCTHQ